MLFIKITQFREESNFHENLPNIKPTNITCVFNIQLIFFFLETQLMLRVTFARRSMYVVTGLVIKQLLYLTRTFPARKSLAIFEGLYENKCITFVWSV